MIKKTLILGILLLGVINSFSQNQYLFNHYIANQGLLNPAYNGSRDVISGMLVHRQQWLGIPGAPMTSALNVHGAIEDTKVGLGLSIVNDHLGFSNSLDFLAAGTYKIVLDRGEKNLMLGLQMGATSMIYDGTKAIIDKYPDPVFNGKTSRMFFNAGFGAYFFSDEFFVGFSIPKFFANSFDEDYEQFRNEFKVKNMHMYIYGGYIFEWISVKVRPAMLIKQVYGAPMELDLSASVLLADIFWLGLSYRTTREAVFFMEWIISRQFTFRYSFDYSFTSLARYAKAGSHEASLQFDFTTYRRPGMKTIRHW